MGIAKKAGKLTFGMDEVKENILKNKVKNVIITSDLAENSMGKIQKIVNENYINVVKISCTKDDINLAVGKYSGIIGVLDDRFAEKITALAREDNQEECNI